ncbi:MAG TPA: NADH-quinone oxidoreductase subunit C [Actinophytocola sp.]|nr:NADH-quinone oxidoreductase subunit C [Actinophytocola sp.]
MADENKPEEAAAAGDTPAGTPAPGEAQSSAERPADTELRRQTEDALPQAPVAPREPLVAGKERRGMFNVAGSGDTSGFGGLRLPAHVAAPAERPYGGWFDEFTDTLLAAMREQGIPTESIQQVTVAHGEITYYVDPQYLVALCRLLRDDAGLRFELCSSVSGVDYGVGVPQRIHSVYHLTSMTYRRRIRLEVAIDWSPEEGGNPHCPSVVEVYPTADWHERETWDMFGVIYDGHPALTRILMPDDWDGHPQRKDYPLGGIPVEYKGAEIPPPDQRRSYS